jgi:hypothetical protein
MTFSHVISDRILYNYEVYISIKLPLSRRILRKQHKDLNQPRALSKITMNKLEGQRSSFQIDIVSEVTRIIRAGKNLDQVEALKLAFPNAQKIDSFGFTIIGDDLRIRKYNLK